MSDDQQESHQQRVERLIKAAGLTPKTFADKSRVDVRTAEKFIDGTSNPQARTLARYARTLGVTMQDLYPGEFIDEPDVLDDATIAQQLDVLLERLARVDQMVGEILALLTRAAAEQGKAQTAGNAASAARTAQGISDKPHPPAQPRKPPASRKPRKDSDAA